MDTLSDPNCRGLAHNFRTSRRDVSVSGHQSDVYTFYKTAPSLRYTYSGPATVHNLSEVHELCTAKLARHQISSSSCGCVPGHCQRQRNDYPRGADQHVLDPVIMSPSDFARHQRELTMQEETASAGDGVICMRTFCTLYYCCPLRKLLPAGNPG